MTNIKKGSKVWIDEPTWTGKVISHASKGKVIRITEDYAEVQDENNFIYLRLLSHLREIPTASELLTIDTAFIINN